MTPLNIKTDNTLLRSLIKVDDLIKYASKLEIKSLALADTNLYGVMDFYKLAINNNIKPIIGLDIDIDNNHAILYCMNFSGYKNLIKLNTIKSERDITINDLKLYSSDLICLVPYESFDLYNNICTFYKYAYRTYKNKQEKDDIKEPSLYMNEVLCLAKEELKYLEVLDKMRGENPKSYPDNYLLCYDNDLVNSNNERLNTLCNLEIPLNGDLIPKFNNNENISSKDYLKKKCIDGMKNKFGDKVNKVYQDRLKYELSVIFDKHFEDYFLIVADYVSWAKANNILVGPGRGSAVSSLVAYLLDITEVDPVKNDLLFERFLNKDRQTMPDIDIDFEHIKRDDVINYCISKYGEKKVLPIIAFATFGLRQTIRDLGTALNIDEYVINNLSSMLDSNLSLRDNYNNKDVFNYITNNNLKEFANISLKIEGLKHHLTIHAAGIVISNTDLDEIIPIVNYNSRYITGIDMTYLEEIGLLKMDFLAIKYLTIIHDIIDDINSKYNLNIEFNNIPDGDKKALEIFKKGLTLGIFQFESNGMINILKKLKPENFADITAAMALFRPGPMKNIDTYIANKNNIDCIKYIDPKLESILKPTYGILIYQEQIMKIATDLASFSATDADMLRKAMSKKKKDVLLSLKDKFVAGCISNNIAEEKALKIYDLMLKFAEYGFNKSHSYGYSLVSYRMAYLKAHYPYVFLAKMLKEELGDKEKVKKYLKECQVDNIRLLKPNINISTKEFIEYDNSLVMPLSAIKGVPLSLVENIISERENGKFEDIFDFVKRVKIKDIDALINLIKASAFSSFSLNTKTLIESIDIIKNYGDLLNEVDSSYNLKPIIYEVEDYDLAYKLNLEKEVFGFYLSNHPVASYKAKYNNVVSLADIDAYFNKDINIVAYVESIRETMTRKNDKMAFMLISDETGDADAVIFPTVYANIKKIDASDIILLNGKVEKRFDKYQIVVNKIKKLKD